MAKRRQADLLRSLQAETLPADFLDACRHYRIRTKEGGLVTFDPERWHAEQRRLHDERTGRDIILKPRQIGITTGEALRGLHQAHTRIGWNVRIVIHDEELGEALFRTVSLADASVRERGMAPVLGTERAKELEFKALASSIAIGIAGARPQVAAKQGRSGTIHRLHATEVAFWSHPAVTMTGLLNAVPDTGEVVIESTPNGASGWFYDECQAALRGDSRYKLHFFAWHEHAAYRLPVPADFDGSPRDEHEERLLSLGVDAEQITWWRAKVSAIGLDGALQEFPADPVSCFRASGRPYIEQDTLDWLAAQVREPLRVEDVRGPNEQLLGRLLVWEDPDPGDTYIVGGDVAEGVGKDGHAADVMSRRTGRTAATLWSDTLKPGDFGHALLAIGHRYATVHGPAVLAPERNNHGHAALTVIEAAYYQNIYVHDDGRHGWATTPATRPVLFDDLARAYETRATWTPDAGGVSEAATLIRDKDGQPRARGKSKGHSRDDRYVARAIAWQVRQRTPAPSTTVGASVKRRSEADDVGGIL